MKKICLIANGDFDNKKLWSGTPSRLREEFSCCLGYPVDTINYCLPKFWRSICARLLSRYEFVTGTTRDPWYRFFAESRLAKKLKHLAGKNEFFLFIGSHNCPSPEAGFGKFAVYIDNLLEVYSGYLDGNVWWRKCYEDCVFKYDLRSLRNASVIFTQNEWTRTYLIHDVGIRPEVIFNVGFGVNLTPYDGPKDYDAQELLIVLRRGTEHYKGLDLLLSAFEIVHRKFPRVKLNVVGTTQKKMEGVFYWEKHPRSKTVELFQKASLYVMPALREPNGITYLEALANRTPIVGLDRFAFPEFSGNGQWGFICRHDTPDELAVVIEDALSNTDRLVSMGFAGQKFVEERYCWKKVTGAMLAQLENL